MRRLTFIIVLLATGCCSTDGFPGGGEGMLRDRDDPYTIQRAEQFERNPLSSFLSFLLGNWD